MPPASPAPPQVSASPRVRLGRLALEAALAAPDVVDAEVGPSRLRVTVDSSANLLRGVSVTAEADGRYGVDLCLVAGMVSLVALGDEVQRRVREGARRDGLADQLGTINVEFARLVSPEEAQQQAEDVLEVATGTAAVAALTPAEESGR